MAKRKGEQYAPTRDIVSRAKDWTVIATAFIVTATLIAGAVRNSGPILDSGPMPFPSRSEVQAVDSKLEMVKARDAETHQKMIGQLEELADGQREQKIKDRLETADRLASRLAIMQTLVANAKLAADKEPSLDNQQTWEVLQSQLRELQNAIKANLEKH